MKKYLKTGVITHMRDNPGMFVDLPETLDYQEALNIVHEAGVMFDELPGSVRKRFNNSAVEFLDFMNDEVNLEESIELGLRVEEEEIEPVLDPPASPVEEPAAPPE